MKIPDRFQTVADIQASTHNAELLPQLDERTGMYVQRQQSDTQRTLSQLALDMRTLHDTVQGIVDSTHAPEEAASLPIEDLLVQRDAIEWAKENPIRYWSSSTSAAFIEIAEMMLYLEKNAFGQLALDRAYIEGEAARYPTNFTLASAEDLKTFPDPERIVGYGYHTLGHENGEFTVDQNEGYVVGVAVFKAWRARGIARGVMEMQCETMYGRQNVPAIHLTMRPDNTPMRKLVESLNFKQSGNLGAMLYSDRLPRVAMTQTRDGWEDYLRDKSS